MSTLAMLKKFTLHSRPISKVCFNPDGDLLIASSLDHSISIWGVEGRFVGTLDGHSGAVWTFSVNEDSTTVVSGGADLRCVEWDMTTGCIKREVGTNSTIKSVYYVKDGCYYACDDSYQQRPLIGFLDSRSSKPEILPCNSVPTEVISDISENYIIFSNTEGTVTKIDRRTQKELNSQKIHQSKINEIKNSRCKTFFMSSSTDCNAKIIDTESFKVKKTFRSPDPVNSASIFNTNDILVLAGGTLAVEVTLTKGNNQFDVHFYDIPTERQLGHYSPHFGTINSVDIHPNGSSLCSGGEEGIISICEFDTDYKKIIAEEIEKLK